MINRYNNYSAKKAASREPLPAGGYVCRILDVKMQSYDWGDVLVLSHDVMRYFGEDEETAKRMLPDMEDITDSDQDEVE